MSDYLDARYTNSLTQCRRVISCRGNTNANLSGTPIPAPRWQTMSPAPIPSAREHRDFSANASFTAHYYWQSRTWRPGTLRQWRGQQDAAMACSYLGS